MRKVQPRKIIYIFIYVCFIFSFILFFFKNINPDGNNALIALSGTLEKLKQRKGRWKRQTQRERKRRIEMDHGSTLGSGGTQRSQPRDVDPSHARVWRVTHFHCSNLEVTASSTFPPPYSLRCRGINGLLSRISLSLSLFLSTISSNNGLLPLTNLWSSPFHALSLSFIAVAMPSHSHSLKLSHLSRLGLSQLPKPVSLSAPARFRSVPPFSLDLKVWFCFEQSHGAFSFALLWL